METDGSIGAARGAGVGAGIYKSFGEAFSTLKSVETVEPDQANRDSYLKAYSDWKAVLLKNM
jgi:xylulokinase